MMTFSSKQRSFNSKLLLKVSQVPDWERRAIRLSLALVFFCSLGVTLWAVPEQYREEWGDEVVQSCNWAGATCAVVAASPLIGKVAQLSYERTLGTLTGGVLGFLVYDYGILLLPDNVDQVFMVACAAAVGFLSCWLSNKFKLDASMRLFVITFLIVTFGANSNDRASASGVALLRTGGIISGVLLFMSLTIIILPKSATIESLREMKTGLKLLTELNSLVWTSKREAEAAMKQAAAKAREAEASADAAAAAKEGQPPPPRSAAAAAASAASAASAGRPGGVFGLWSRWFGTLGTSRRSASADGYVALPGSDPEAGHTATAAAPARVPAAAAGPAGAGLAGTGGPSAAAAAAAPQGSFSSSSSSSKLLPATSGGPVSQLTKALRHSSGSTASSSSVAAAPSPTPLDKSEQLLSGPSLTGKPTPLNSQQQQQSDVCAAKNPDDLYDEIIEQYEIRCEAVLTSVYQSMFKVKELIGVANSELYVHHLWGHYIFLPIFFSHALVNYLFPKRWKLPSALLDELATSVRVLARLLWTVHLDYSQGFDEVLAALPASANMGNLLLELGEVMSAALGVLVEAFPNKNSILVDSFDQLDALVDRILDISEASHHKLIHDLAAHRPKALLRPLRASSLPDSPHAPPAAVATSSGAGEASFSACLGLDQGRPGAAAVAAVNAAQSLGQAATTAGVATAVAAAKAVASELVPSRQVAFVTFAGTGDPPAAGVSARGNGQLFDSLALEGLAGPIPAESPQILSPQQQQQHLSIDMSAAAAPGAGRHGSPATAAPAVRADSQADLIFDVSDLPGTTAGAAAAPDALVSPAAGAAGARSLTPGLNRHLSAIDRADAAAALGSQGSSLFKSKFRPYAVMAAVKLQRAAAGDSCDHCGTPAALAAAAALTEEQHLSAKDLLRSLSTISAPDPATAEAAALLLQQHQAGVGGADPLSPGVTGAAAAAAPGAVAVAAGGALDECHSMNFVKLTRWYSFQFLMMELVDEMDRLYCCIQKVLSALPHGL